MIGEKYKILKRTQSTLRAQREEKKEVYNFQLSVITVSVRGFKISEQ
ncbi:hypothetical protein GXM_02141 [Nostoc sphaeroides CCNUC1]|uniref:Uncharacterized protein n=1 Tax=Nostoc sphaeroides CCNUC1 TaxID=2653204 RepID=A0A5P8VWZ8_9NOSO|nr:hypothetical protein GXM_02141 [Nostoc sphaeroides CCNUC1]